MIMFGERRLQGEDKYFLCRGANYLTMALTEDEETIAAIAEEFPDVIYFKAQMILDVPTE
jgi:hypothetical protein